MSPFNLTFYMKSGNSFTLNNVLRWELGVNIDRTVNRIKLEQNNKIKLIVQSLSLSQIEAIIEEIVDEKGK